MFFSFLKRLLFGRKLEKSLSTFFYASLQNISTLSSREKIIQYDIVYYKILQGLGYTGSFGEILKKNPKEIHDIQSIWMLHKLRNKLVHELGNTKDIYKREAQEYEQSIKKILIKVGK